MATIQEQYNFVNSLSPVKKRIALYLFGGLTKEQTAKKISTENNSSVSNATAYVTMVIKSAFNLGIIFKSKEKVKRDYNKGYGKQKVRNENLYWIEDSAKNYKLKDGLFLTLSSWECIMEKMINKKYSKFNFVSCEIDKIVFNDLKKEIKNNNLYFMSNVYQKPIGDLINEARKNTYSHINLDYCKTLLRNKAFCAGDDIKNAISKDVVKVGGLIMITVAQRGVMDKTPRIELIEMIKKYGKNRYEIVFSPLTGYRDGSPMYSIIIRRIK